MANTEIDGTKQIRPSTVTESDLLISNNTTGNVSTTAHGFAPILPNVSTTYLSGTGVYTTPAGSGNMNTTTYDPAGIAQQVVGATATQALTNKDLTGTGNTFPTFNQSTTGNAATANKSQGLVVSTAPYSVGVSAAAAPSSGQVLTATSSSAATWQAIGNAATATKLATPRAINGVNFDGTAAITVADATKVPTTTTVNGHALSANVTVSQTDVGLSNVNNTSDATKNSATATLTSKTIDATSNTISNVANLSVSRQDDTTNATVGSTRIETGWGVITPGASNVATETITFKTAFTNKPIVTAVYGGDSASSTTYGSGGINIVAIAFCAAYSITTSTFIVRLRTFDGNPWGTGNTVFYQWTAIGI